MDNQRNPRDEAIIGRDARTRPEARRAQPERDEAVLGDFEVEFISEIPDQGGEA